MGKKSSPHPAIAVAQPPESSRSRVCFGIVGYDIHCFVFCFALIAKN